MAEVRFDSLRLEAWNPMRKQRGREPGRDSVDALREALRGLDMAVLDGEEDSVPLKTHGGEKLGMVRFRFSCEYVHRKLVREFFESDFMNPDEAWVIRVSEPTGQLLYENAPTPSDRFEVRRILSAPSFVGVLLQLRYKDRSIEEEVRRLALTKTALIGFIDLMLLAGLFLVLCRL